MVTPLLGLVGTGSWTDAATRKKDWTEAVFRLFPNGSAPLTALTSKMSETTTVDPEFYWWTKTLSEQAGAITGVYTNDDMNSSYTSGGAAGDSLRIKCAEATAAQFRVGHQVLLRDSSNYTVDVNGKVTAVLRNGSSSRITVKLLEADDNGVGNNLSDADRILVIGNMNEEGAAMPTALTYEATKIYNYTQIFRTPLIITRTQRQTSVRGEHDYLNLKKEALELHSIEMEKAFLWGIKTENDGDDGQKVRSTLGYISALKQYNPTNCTDYTLDAKYTGKTWLQSGKDWFNIQLERVFRYGSNVKLGLIGTGALLGLNNLAETFGQISLTSKTIEYGLAVVEWLTPFGKIELVTHPLFSLESTNRNSLVILEPKQMKVKNIQKTVFLKDALSGDSPHASTYARRDGTYEEFLTEKGLLYGNILTGAYLNGIGLDNKLSE